MASITAGQASLWMPVQAQTLEGRIEEQSYRLVPPSRRGDTANVGLRLNRTTTMNAGKGVIQSEEFPPVAPSLVGNARADKPLAGILSSQDFVQPPKNFDIGADRNSKEMTLAWERWHKQLAGVIYDLWSQRANSRGRAVVRVTVYRNRIIVPEIISSSGGPDFRNVLMSVFTQINNNPGLSFPAKSQRQKVTFEAEYIADTDVDPGYSWLKNDYEKIRHDY